MRLAKGDECPLSRTCFFLHGISKKIFFSTESVKRFFSSTESVKRFFFLHGISKKIFFSTESVKRFFSSTESVKRFFSSTESVKDFFVRERKRILRRSWEENYILPPQHSQSKAVLNVYQRRSVFWDDQMDLTVLLLRCDVIYHGNALSSLSLFW